MDIISRRKRLRQAAKVRHNYRCFLRSIRDVNDPLKNLSESLFKRPFRLTKPICRHFIGLLRPFMVERAQKHGLTIQTKVMCALRFYAHGCYQFPVGHDPFISLSLASVSRAIFEVTTAIAENLADEFIQFPDDVDAAIKQKFYEMGMPGCIGLVDGTHIAIKKPPDNVEHVYYSIRKNCHTKNVQIICDANLRILSINPRYGGSAHDSFIWNNSFIKQVLQHEYANGVRNSFLLGDSGYGQQPWLFTPLATTHTRPEINYNKTHKKIRSLVERCIGVLKSRFRCLCRQRILMYGTARAGNIIIACAVLHNIMVETKYPEPVEAEIQDNMDEQNGLDEIEEDAAMDSNAIRTAGCTARSRIIRDFF